MNQLIRKTAVAMAATAVISALTGIGSVPAYADSPSIEAMVCNNSPGAALSLHVGGTNQDGQSATRSGSNVPANTCVTTNGYWWKKGSTITQVRQLVGMRGGSAADLCR
jgi:hypothetical protein